MSRFKTRTRSKSAVVVKQGKDYSPLIKPSEKRKLPQDAMTNQKTYLNRGKYFEIGIQFFSPQQKEVTLEWQSDICMQNKRYMYIHIILFVIDRE
jgi:hypothetical protein